MDLFPPLASESLQDRMAYLRDVFRTHLVCLFFRLFFSSGFFYFVEGIQLCSRPPVHNLDESASSKTCLTIRLVRS